MILINDDLLKTTALTLIVKWLIDFLNVNKLLQYLFIRLNTWFKLMLLKK